MSNDIGAALEGTHSNGKTQALTDAAIGVARIRAALTKEVRSTSPFWDIA